MYDDPRYYTLKKFIDGAQRKISPTWENASFDIEEPVLKKGKLKFQSFLLQPMQFEVLAYKVRLKQNSNEVMNTLNVSDNDRWFMMKGLEKDCVYYLKLLDPDAKRWEFNLDKQVCGMRVKF